MYRLSTVAVTPIMPSLSRSQTAPFPASTANKLGNSFDHHHPRARRHDSEAERWRLVQELQTSSFNGQRKVDNQHLVLAAADDDDYDDDAGVEDALSVCTMPAAPITTTTTTTRRRSWLFRGGRGQLARVENDHKSFPHTNNSSNNSKPTGLPSFRSRISNSFDQTFVEPRQQQKPRRFGRRTKGFQHQQQRQNANANDCDGDSLLDETLSLTSFPKQRTISPVTTVGPDCALLLKQSSIPRWLTSSPATVAINLEDEDDDMIAAGQSKEEHAPAARPAPIFRSSSPSLPTGNLTRQTSLLVRLFARGRGKNDSSIAATSSSSGGGEWLQQLPGMMMDSTAFAVLDDDDDDDEDDSFDAEIMMASSSSFADADCVFYDAHNDITAYNNSQGEEKDNVLVQFDPSPSQQQQQQQQSFQQQHHNRTLNRWSPVLVPDAAAYDAPVKKPIRCLDNESKQNAEKKDDDDLEYSESFGDDGDFDDDGGDDSDASVLSLLSGLITAWVADRDAKAKQKDKGKEEQEQPQAKSSRLKSCLKKTSPAVTTTIHSTKSKLRLSVTFDRIQIREYERTVGDNPSCSSGPPISLGWVYRWPALEYAIDDYETNRKHVKRSKQQFRLPPCKRKELLIQEWNCPPEDVHRARHETSYIQYQREKSAVRRPTAIPATTCATAASPSEQMKCWHDEMNASKQRRKLQQQSMLRKVMNRSPDHSDTSQPGERQRQLLGILPMDAPSTQPPPLNTQFLRYQTQPELYRPIPASSQQHPEPYYQSSHPHRRLLPASNPFAVNSGGEPIPGPPAAMSRLVSSGYGYFAPRA